MKARFKLGYVGHPSPELCKEYPNCNCQGHYIYERNNHSKGGIEK